VKQMMNREVLLCMGRDLFILFVRHKLFDNM
jgi:hypothetical protein